MTKKSDKGKSGKAAASKSKTSGEKNVNKKSEKKKNGKKKHIEEEEIVHEPVVVKQENIDDDDEDENYDALMRGLGRHVNLGITIRPLPQVPWGQPITHTPQDAYLTPRTGQRPVLWLW